MANYTGTEPKTFIAAVNTGERVRVYASYPDSTIRETAYERGWSGGTADKILVTSKKNSPIAATSFGVFEAVRLYYLDAQNNLQEHCYDADPGRWSQGGLGKLGFTLHQSSSISAAFINGKSSVRVFGQLPDCTIQEFGYDTAAAGWYKGANFGPAQEGTSVVVTSDNNWNVRVFYQTKDLSLVEKAYNSGDSGWSNGPLGIKSDKLPAAISVTSWRDSSWHIRLFYTTRRQTVEAQAWDGASWRDMNLVVAADAPHLATIHLGKGVVAVYYQDVMVGEDTLISEWHMDEDNWKLVTHGLPPAKA